MNRLFRNTKVVTECIQCALYSDKTMLNFEDERGMGSKVGIEGKNTVEGDSIDNRCSDATFIKMDLEGSEIDALNGAKNTIINNRPKLAISIYHKNEHLYEIPLLLHQWVPEYKLYVRHHSDYTPDTVVYAIVEN